MFTQDLDLNDRNFSKDWIHQFETEAVFTSSTFEPSADFANNFSPLTVDDSEGEDTLVDIISSCDFQSSQHFSDDCQSQADSANQNDDLSMTTTDSTLTSTTPCAGRHAENR